MVCYWLGRRDKQPQCLDFLFVFHTLPPQKERMIYEIAEEIDA